MITLLDLLAFVIICVVLTLMIHVWIKIIQRLSNHRPVITVQPRRQVPWSGWDLLVFFMFFLFASSLLTIHLNKILDPSVTQPLLSDQSDILPTEPSDTFTEDKFDNFTTQPSEKLTKAHPLVDVFVNASWSARIALTLVAVLVAPLFEEMFFRTLFQGWLEKVDRRLRRWLPELARICRWGTLPVIFSSLVFASLHFRFERKTVMGQDVTLVTMLTYSALSLVVLTMVVLVLRSLRGASWSDLGWEPRRIAADVRLGLSAFIAIAIPLMIAQKLLFEVLEEILPVYIAPDPIPLFFFALVLGTLYLRTHRAVASITAHAALNACSMGSLWVSVLLKTFH